MAWSGKFHFGSSYAMYVGSTSDNSLHNHAAFQIAVGQNGHAELCDGIGRRFAGRAVLVRPFVKHQVVSNTDLNIIYLDPKSPILGHFDSLQPAKEIQVLKGPVPSWLSDSKPCQVLSYLENKSDERTGRGIDLRLEGVMAELKHNLGRVSISQAAKERGISESRLRVIANQQLGMPLSTWLLWLKLGKAARALASGACLSEAASSGGFSDQAHFSRTMRKMFGVTPRVAGAVLN